jgi:hypothetical protein
MRGPCVARQRVTTFPGVSMKRIWLVVLACIPLACSSDSVAPQASSVGGQWIYRVTALSDGAQVSCAMSVEDTLFLGRSAATVQGRYAGGRISCSGADVEAINLVTGSVVNGTIDPMVRGTQNVTFDLDGATWHQTGSLSGDRMSGTLTVDYLFAGKLGHTLLAGTWSARRIGRVLPKPQPL